ncbi:hypothetical protein [Kordiimonas gwangyangensis]|uniref:hypothetical protein n=1 Tax=Kordiimonas gwangyangensis TaxID=288022 RepID=UPI00037574AB|nr:hypothetical protein [Kordiimonas gwangyangensis]
MAGHAFNILELKLSGDSEPYGPVFDIFVDGENLLDRIKRHERQYTDSIAGAYAPYLGPEGARSLLDPKAFVTPYACDCGEPECWLLHFSVTEEGDTVRWSNWQNPYRNNPERAAEGVDWRYGDMPVLVFDREAYRTTIEAAVSKLDQHQSK